MSDGGAQVCPRFEVTPNYVRNHRVQIKEGLNASKDDDFLRLKLLARACRASAREGRSSERIEVWMQRQAGSKAKANLSTARRLLPAYASGQ